MVWYHAAIPGMGYPLVPGYEAVGEVIHAEKGAALSLVIMCLCLALMDLRTL